MVGLLQSQNQSVVLSRVIVNKTSESHGDGSVTYAIRKDETSEHGMKI
jgi:hypothetical protein